MAVQYNRLWKLLIDKKMKKSALTELADVSSSTIAKLNRDEICEPGGFGADLPGAPL